MLLLRCDRLHTNPYFASPPLPTRSSCPSLSSRYSWLPRCKPFSSKSSSSLCTQSSATLPIPSTPLRLVACSASKEGDGSTSKHGPASKPPRSNKQCSKHGAGAHSESSANKEGSAADGRRRGDSSAQQEQQHAAHGKQHQKAGSGSGGGSTRSSTGVGRGKPARSKSSAPEQTNKQASRRLWQGQSGEQASGVGHKRTCEGRASLSTSSTSSNSSNSTSNGSASTSNQHRHDGKRLRRGAPLRAKDASATSLDECMRAAKAASTPQQSFHALYNLGKRVQEDKNGKKRYTEKKREGIVEAAHMLAAQLLGLRASIILGSTTTTTTTSTKNASSTSSRRGATLSPVLQLNSMQLSLTVWAFSQLVGVDSRVRNRHLSELVDAIAAHAVGSSVMNRTTDDACMHWSRLLYGIAKMEFSCRDSQVLQQLFEAGARILPQMLHRKQPCAPQSVSNPLWAFATADYHGNLQQLVSEIASNLGWVMKNARPQNWSNAVWALATLRSRKVELGEGSTVSKIVSAGVEGAVQQREKAKPQELSNTLWALATLGHHPGAATIDILATAMTQCISIANPQDLSNTLWALATLDHHPGTATMNTLATAMTQRSSMAKPQALSNTLWALASLDHHPGAATINTLATAIAERISTAKPQELSNAMWAIATLNHPADPATISTLATAMAECSSTAKPQSMSNTLWALATLGHHPSAATINTLATAMVKRSSTAAPQALSNTLWAIATLDHNPGAATIDTLATAVADRSSTAAPQDQSNALQALGSLRWYRPEVYSILAKGVLRSISYSMPDTVGQHFSNALFSCALSCHFDSSVDALAAWGSQQSVQQWTEQEISNTLFAWAILAATTGGDIASMRTLAQRLFQEANRRGAQSFQSCVDGPRHLGKLYGAHLEALHRGLPGGGLADKALLQVTKKVTAEHQQDISKQQSQNTNTVAAALQGHYEVQAAMVHGYHTLLVSHPSCPRGIAIVVTQRYRDYLSHPAGQIYGKTALRLKHKERGCDGLVLCDESELKGSPREQQRDMLMQRIDKQVNSVL